VAAVMSVHVEIEALPMYIRNNILGGVMEKTWVVMVYYDVFQPSFLVNTLDSLDEVGLEAAAQFIIEKMRFLDAP
jgi:hypothetical protein